MVYGLWSVGSSTNSSVKSDYSMTFDHSAHTRSCSVVRISVVKCFEVIVG